MKKNSLKFKGNKSSKGNEKKSTKGNEKIRQR